MLRKNVNNVMFTAVVCAWIQIEDFRYSDLLLHPKKQYKWYEKHILGNHAFSEIMVLVHNMMLISKLLHVLANKSLR